MVIKNRHIYIITILTSITATFCLALMLTGVLTNDIVDYIDLDGNRIAVIGAALFAVSWLLNASLGLILLRDLKRGVLKQRCALVASLCLIFAPPIAWIASIYALVVTRGVVAQTF